MKARTLPLMALAVVATSCGFVHRPYPLAPGESWASVELPDTGGVIRVCKDGLFYGVSTEPQSRIVRVPASGRIAIGQGLMVGNRNSSSSCHPMVSFTPRAGGNYVMAVDVVGEQCSLQLVQEDPASPAGVALETSVGPRDCFQDRKKEAAREAERAGEPAPWAN